jgi:hypothetical protein
MKLATQHSSFLLGAWEEPAGQPYRRVIAEVFDGRELIVIRLSLRPMAAINSTQVVYCHIRETAIVFPFDTHWPRGFREGLEELRRLQVNIGLRHQNRVVLHADNQIAVLLEGLPEGIASLEDTVCNVDLEGFRVWVNSFSNEVIVEACLLGIVFVNIDLPKLAAERMPRAEAGRPGSGRIRGRLGVSHSRLGGVAARNSVAPGWRDFHSCQPSHFSCSFLPRRRLAQCFSIG